MLTLAIILGMVSYTFVGMTAGIITKKETKDSSFWDETMAGVCMGMFWPIAIPTIYMLKTSDKLVDVLEKRAKQKLLPTATATEV